MRTPVFIATVIIFHLPFNQLFAQQNGYFGTWEKDFGISQVWQEVNSFDEWKTLNENYSQDGFIPTDFETYQVDGEDKYFGAWQRGTGKGYWWVYWTTMENWMNTNDDLVENQGAVLADFEKFNIDGQDWYFGIWHTGNKEQQVRIADNLEEWTSINENMLNNENLKLVDFEKYEENGTDKYFGAWQSRFGEQQTSILNSLEEWSAINKDFVENQGFNLVDFEHFRVNGKTQYFGVWKSGSDDQQTIVVNSLEEWSTWNDLFGNQNLILQDFEKFEDVIINPIFPPEKTITDEDLIEGITYNWYKDTTYLLKDIVTLEIGGVLNIEAGTLIRALPAAEGEECAGLFIEPGAKIFAKGANSNCF